MKNCKDCIHYDVCGDIYDEYSVPFGDPMWCHFFELVENPEFATYKEVFLHRFPNAKLDYSGSPAICMRCVFGDEVARPPCKYGSNCEKCWNSPYKY